MGKKAKLVAIDSKDFRRGGKAHPQFTAALGVAVTIQSHDDFKKAYDETLRSAFGRCGIG